MCSLEVRESKPDGQIDGPFKSTLVGILVDKKKMHVLGQGLAIESEIDVNIFFFLVCGVLVKHFCLIFVLVVLFLQVFLNKKSPYCTKKRHLMCVKTSKEIEVFFLHLKSNNVLPVFLLCLLGRSFGSKIQSMM